MNNRGFTIFFATLVASLALAIGLGIYDVVVRQLGLSTTVSQSQYAIYAADSGAECALYWDSKYGGSGSAFATSSASNPPTSGIVCGSYDMAAAGTPPVPFATQPTGWTPWSVVSTANAATTTFTLTFPGYSYCAVVEVGKTTDVSGTVQTIAYSHGFNTCVPGATQLERELKITY
ncbi:hypothetical protein K2Q00_02245 [Patescibacteria group bacterium]|nr:hypothetical protein [Patescibacteria group bacterium]